MISGLWYSAGKIEGSKRPHVLNSFQTSGNSPGAASCRVGILGFGIVGSAIARRLTGLDSIPSLELTLICDRRAHEEREGQPRPVARLVWADRFDDLLAGGVREPAVDDVRDALLREITLTGAGGGDLIAIARDRAAIVPAAVLTGPETIRGFPDHQLAEAV
jgi:hypothetical protein